MRLVGIYWILRETPVWLLLLTLEFALVDILWLMRRAFEGWPYNNSLSSEIGDRRLVMAGAGIAATILQRGHPPHWPALPAFHAAVVTTAVAIGVIISLRNRDATFADGYHNAVIVPVLVALTLCSAPVIAFRGTVLERLAAAACVLCWAALVRYDGRQGRLKQVQWLVDNGMGHRLTRLGDGPSRRLSRGLPPNSRQNNVRRGHVGRR